LFGAILIFFFRYGGGVAMDGFLLDGRNWRNSLGGNFFLRGVTNGLGFTFCPRGGEIRYEEFARASGIFLAVRAMDKKALK
jgi:hypothetical protein